MFFGNRINSETEYLKVFIESIPLGRLHSNFKRTHLTIMDKAQRFENRRLKLIELRDARCGGKNATLAKIIGKNSTYIDKLFYPEGKKGKKNISDEILVLCEEKFDLIPGWFDLPPDVIALKIEDREFLEMVKLMAKMPAENRKSFTDLCNAALKLSGSKEQEDDGIHKNNN